MENSTIDKTELMTFDTIAAASRNESQIRLAKHLTFHPEDYRCEFLHSHGKERPYGLLF